MDESGVARIGVLVADSGAFIKASPLEKWSGGVVTVKEVASEIRDEHTRRRMQMLPYTLTFREPTSVALRRVTEFAKKTGDYQSLSAVDLKVIALTYHLECEEGTENGANLRTEPARMLLVSKRPPVPGIVGFYSGWKGPKSKESEGETKHEVELLPQDHETSCSEPLEMRETDGMEGILEQNGDGEEIRLDSNLGPTDDTEEDFTDGNGGQEEREGDIDDDDDVGWITPDNFQEACEVMGGALEVEPKEIAVGCVTTDFAMQNVMLQMGLNVISVEGMRIKQLRTYGMKCKACFKTTTNTVELFCPSCGNRTLYKVSMVMDSDGRVEYRPLSKKQFSHRGLRYSLPLPKGGRHADNPILAPDQRVTYKERRKRVNKVDPLDRDYIARDSPFSTKDVTSRGAKIAFAKGGRGGRRRNPNEVKPKGRRK